ncbi:uncharacterized protein DEA37_0002013 [Paragonimus westermani]|uniref:PP1-binding domain-containing protein n=1 Tax=Paragonimus westermani TaxID=34504 RepID=A0A5J4P246_9TREM|nr:uncharacterized protein DEA37_0002013 [Paragonimus westermani]
MLTTLILLVIRQAATPTAAGDIISNSQTPQSVARSLKIATPDSMPKVHPTKKFTPKPAPVSPARSPRPVHITPKSTLGTRERYGPVPLRPPPTSPAIQVVRHATAKSPLKSISSNVSKGRRSNTGTAQVHYTSERRTSGTLRGSTDTFVPKGAKKPNEISSRRNLTSQSPRLNTVLLRSPTPRKLLSPRHPYINKSSVIGHAPSSVLPLRTVASVSRSPSSNRKNVSQKNSPHSTSRNSSHRIATHTDTPTLNSTFEFDDKKSLSSVLPSAKTKCVQSQEFKAADVHIACPATTHGRRNLKRPATARVSMLTENILTAASKRTKGVSFGPALSPEQFDKCLPPSTPVKKGAIPPIVYTPQSLSSPKLRSPAPLVQKPTPMLCEKTPNRTTAGVLFSPSYISTTPNRISGVISQPPTPDTNLLDSVSEYDSISHSAGANPVATAHYSAPVSKSTLTRQTNTKANCRHSFALGSTHFISHYTEQKTLRVPPSTPASVHRYSYNDQRNASKSKLSPKTNSTDNAILSSQTKHGLHIISSSKSAGQRSTKATPMTTFTVADMFTSDESVSTSAEKIRLPRSSLLLTVKHSPVSTLDSIQQSTAKTSTEQTVGRFRNNLESVVTPRLSGVAGMFEDTSEVASPARGVGRPRSSSASASGKRSSVSVQNLVQQSAARTPSMVGVRRLLKTPKSATTPRLSGVAGMFEDTSEVASPARGVGRPRSSSASASGKRSSVSVQNLVQQSAARTPSMVGVRRLLKTPKSAATPRLSGVAGMFEDTSEVASPARGVGRPRSSSASASGKRSSVSVQNLVQQSAARTPSMVGVRRLLKTPKSAATPRLSGVAGMFEDTSEVASPARGVGRPRSSSASASGKRSSVSVQNLVQQSAARTPSMVGVRRLLKTPKSAATPRLSGVAGMFEDTNEVASPARGVGRPRSSSASASGKRSSVSVQNLVQQSAARTPSMVGVRRLLKTPKSATTPRLSGVAGMFEDTSEVASPARGVGRPRSTALSGEKRLPVGSLRNIHRGTAKTPRLTGIRRLLKTPVVVKSPRLAGVRQLVKSPQALVSPSLSGLKRLLKTPKLCVSPRLSGLADLIPLSPESQKNPAAIGIMLMRKAGRRQTAVRAAASDKPMPNPASSRLVRKRALPNTVSSDSCDVPPPKIGKNTTPQAAAVRSTRAGSRKLPKPVSSVVALPLTHPTESSRSTARYTSRSKHVRPPSAGGAGSPPKKPIKTKVNGVSATIECKPTQKRTPVKNALLRVTRQRRGLTKVSKSVDESKEEHSSPRLQGRARRTKKTSTTKRSDSKTVGPNSTTNITKVLNSPASSVQKKSLRTRKKRKSVPSTEDQAKKLQSTTRTMKKTTALLPSVHSHVVVSPRKTRAANRIHK